MAKVTNETLIADVLKINQDIAPILLRHGMNCVNCPGAQRETLEDAAGTHGMDVESLVEEINLFLSTASA